ncbi:hypothetical protein, partial [Klebsiella pneumoniae]|uniref:hypothetical protein n=1 Tax=Klebsiella pneumoniae TaxID=573 RepID=UPI0029DC2F37
FRNRDKCAVLQTLHIEIGNGEDANQNGVCLLAELRGQSPSRFVIARQTLSPWTELQIYK